MEEWNTLGSVADGQRFLYGGVIFTKDSNTADDLVMCHVGDTAATVYISNCAVVAFSIEAEPMSRHSMETQILRSENAKK